jgi:hypothetical protein
MRATRLLVRQTRRYLRAQPLPDGIPVVVPADRAESPVPDFLRVVRIVEQVAQSVCDIVDDVRVPPVPVSSETPALGN